MPYVRPSVRGPKETGRSPIEALSFPFGKRIAPTHPAHFTPVNIIPPDTNPARDIFTAGTFGDGLLKAQKNYALKQTTVTRPAERELRLDLNQARPQGLQLEEVEDAC